MTDEVLIAEAERLREALKEIVQSCTSTPVALNDGFGTCVVTAPSMHALADYILKLTEKGKGVMLRFDICYSPEELEEMVRIGKVRKCANCDTILGLSQNCECGFS